MGRLFTSGFELQSLTAGMEFETVVPTYLSIDTGTKRSGAASLLLNLTSSDHSEITSVVAAFATGRTYYGRCYIKVDTLPGASCSIMGFGLSGSYYTVARLQTNGKVALYDVTTQIGSDSSSAINDGNWHRVEIKCVYATGAIELKLDGTVVASGTGTVAAFNQFTVGGAFWSDNTTGKWWFDDLALNDDQGSYQNTYPGDGKVILLRPNGAGESAQWLRAGTDSGANWSQCNNIPPNDATSYVRTTTLNNLDMYACTDSGIGASDVVNVVEVGGRMCRSAATCPSFKFRIVKTGGGTQALSAAIVPNSATWWTNANATPRKSPIILYLDPDSAAWTQTTLDSMQIGVVMTVNQTPYVWISSVWAIVDYTTGSTFNESTTLAASSALTGANFLAIQAAVALQASGVVGPGSAGSVYNPAAALIAMAGLSPTIQGDFIASAILQAAADLQGAGGMDHFEAATLSGFAAIVAAAALTVDKSVALGGYAGVGLGVQSLISAATSLLANAGISPQSQALLGAAAALSASAGWLTQGELSALASALFSAAAQIGTDSDLGGLFEAIVLASSAGITPSAQALLEASLVLLAASSLASSEEIEGAAALGEILVTILRRRRGR